MKRKLARLAIKLKLHEASEADKTQRTIGGKASGEKVAIETSLTAALLF